MNEPEQLHATAFADLERIPLTEQYLPATPYRAICRSAERFPERPALTFLESGEKNARSVTRNYREFVGDIHRVANALRSLGIGPDDVVTLLMPNGPEYPALLWGAQVAGVVNPVNPLLETEHIAGLMRAAQTQVLVTLAPQPPHAQSRQAEQQAAQPQPGLWEKALALAAEVPGLRAIVAVGGDPQTELPPADIRTFHLSSLTRSQPDQLTFEASHDPDKVGALFHTGGTTGRPKLAQHTHFNEVFDGWSCGAALGVTEQDTVLCGLPLFHVNGVIVTGIMPLSFGAQIVLVSAQGYRDPSVLPNFWRLVEERRVSIFSGVPTIYSTLLNLDTGGRDLSSLRFGICGAAPMPPALLKAVEQKAGLTVLEGYGLTEGTCVSTVNPPAGPRKSGSIGLPLPYHQLRVAQLEEGGHFARDCAPDEVGVLLIRGANVIPGYKEDEHNAGLWVDIAGERWLNTGDLARVDTDGYFALAGRKKELIIRSGHNIDPLVIEEAFARHPDVAMAAAVGRPDRYAGEVPVVYVQLRPGAAATEGALLDFATPHIAERPALPKAVRIVPQLPMTAVGKLFKPQLVWAEVQQELVGALAQAGIPATAEVGPDKARGLLARVRVSPEHLGAAQGLLEGYAVPFEVTAE